MILELGSRTWSIALKNTRNRQQPIQVYDPVRDESAWLGLCDNCEEQDYLFYHVQDDGWYCEDCVWMYDIISTREDEEECKNHNEKG